MIAFLIFIYILGFVIAGCTAGFVLGDDGYSAPEALSGALIIGLFWPIVMLVVGVRTVYSFSTENW